MKKILILILFFMNLSLSAQDQKIVVNESSVELSRILSRDIFELNGVPFMQPMVEAINATSNSRFFNSAYVPTDNKFYVKFGLHGMLGFVRDDMRTYKPQFPTTQYTDTALINNYLTINVVPTFSVSIRDTANLMAYLLRTLLYDGINVDKNIEVPDETATLLGSQNKQIIFKDNALTTLAKKRIASIEAQINALTGGTVSNAIPDSLENSIYSAVGGIPGFFSLPSGGNFSTLGAGVPQFEIGSWYGTELLIRYIPPVNMGEEIGDFSFYGVGLKHNLSQHLKLDKNLNIAVQAVYQGTSLKNKVGVTNAELTADATMLNTNLHASWQFEDWFSTYSGISFESLNIKSKFVYVLPVEIQHQLGLLDDGYIVDEAGNDIPIDDIRYRPKLYEPSEGYPGDTKPQTSTLTLDDFNIKAVLGVKFDLGPLALFFDYNISKFDLFTAGLQYTMNFTDKSIHDKP